MGAARFTAASSERWTRTSGTLLDRMSNYTATMWVRQASTDLIHGIFSLWNDGDNYEQYGVATLWEGTYKLFIAGWGSSVSGLNSAGSTLSTGTWYHLAFRRTGTTCEILLNGVSDITVTLSNATSSKNTLTMSMGCLVNYDGTFIYYDDGRIAAPKMWQTNLTDQEIRSEMRRTYPVRLADLYEFWPIRNTSTQAVGHAKARNWTETNTPTYEDGPPIQIRWIQPLLIVPAAAGGTTHLASASLTGEGTMTAAGALTAAGAATLSGDGTLAGNGVLVAAGASSLIGEGAMTAAGLLTAAGAATISGEGTLGAAATATFTAAAAFAGEGTMTAGAVLTAAAAATLSGEGTLGVAGNLTAAGSAALAGEGTLAAAALATYSGSSILAGEGLLTASGIVVTPGASSSAALSGEGLLTASAEVVRYWLTPPSLGGTIAGSSAGGAITPSTSLRGTYP